MHIILGGTGHIGSATAMALLRNGEPVTVVTRERAHAEALERAGATIAVADVHDVEATRAILRTGRRALLINPPADVRGDSDIEERRTASAIVEAVKGSGLEKVVAVSTYGAQPGERLGDLNVLFEFEVGLHLDGRGKAQAPPRQRPPIGGRSASGWRALTSSTSRALSTWV